jgi:hypothetical protein
MPIPQLPSPLIRRAIQAAALLGAITRLSAGSFTTDFASGLPAGSALFGDNGEGNAGVIEEGFLKLTKAVGSQQGAFIIDDLDAGKAVHGFSAAFKLFVGRGSGADGFSFNFGSDIPDGGIGEEGVGTGLSVCFDTYDNGGGEAPAIDIKKGGAVIASVKGVGLLFRKDAWVNVKIQVDADGTLDLSLDNSVIYSNLIGAFVPTPGRFAFGARTGGSFDNHWVDDISIATVTTGPTAPKVSQATPQGLGVPATAVVTATIEDSATKVAAGSVQLRLNGTVVSAQVATSGSATTVTYDPPGLLPSGSTNQVELRFKDTANPPVEQVFAWTFVAEAYRSLDAARAIPAAQIDKTQRGFTVRTVKARMDSVFVTSSAPYEALLAGTAIDGATGKPYENMADLSAFGPDGLFVEEETINYEDMGGTAGNFLDDRRTPGMPGTDGISDRYALEILTYLELPAGLVTLGVNSDDGFRLLSGTPDPRSALSLLLGDFEGGRGASDTLCSFVVEQAGIYPIRLFYYDGTSTGSVEFFSVMPDGSKVLVNDPNTAGAIKAYRARAGTAPALPPFLLSAAPAPGEVNVSIKPKVDLLIRDTTLALDPASVQVSLNGTPVTATVTKTGGDTLVSFRPSASLPGKTPATVKVSYRDTGANAQTVTQEWRFTTAEATATATGMTAVKINFQNSTSEGFPGYLPDNGVAFADRGNGFSYGWNKDNSANARNRNQTDKALAPDERYDTFNHMQKPGGPWIWEIAVPNGTYEVSIVGGESNNFDQTIRIKAEDVLVVNGVPCTTTERFRDGKAKVKVEDGRLSVSASEADGAVNCKIAFLEIFAEEISADLPAKPVAITVTRNGDNLVISWPADAVGFTLESSPSLGGAWTAVGGVTGNSASLPAQAAQQFYRLKK